MEQNQPTVDNDLQKAIDDITNTTNIDPVFSDPVAAPSSVPEGDTGELSEPVGPFPAPEPAPMPQEPAPIPEAQPVVEQPVVEQPVTPEAAPIPPMPEQPIAPVPPEAPIPEAPIPEAPVPPMPEPILNPEPMVETSTVETFTTEAPAQNLNMHQVKEAALRDLVPLIDRLNMSASQKFNLYRDIFDNMRDYTVLEPAYRSAKEITDETERAEALLYLVESIDKM